MAAKKSTITKNKYNANNYDSLRIVVPRGAKAAIQATAESQGENINRYVRGAIQARMKADGADGDILRMDGKPGYIRKPTE